MPILDLFMGRPLANWEEQGEQVGPAAGIPIFGLDALSSAAYGPEAALTLLIPLGVGGLHYIIPVVASIVVLLTIVYFSYRQTIEAYPKGGGSYTVASENLGRHAGLLAAAALMIDYVLTAAVGISAGVGALVSAVPKLQPHILGLCLLILVLLSLVNVRGVRDTGVAFLVPTYLFVGCLLTVILLGLFHVIVTGGHPKPIMAVPVLPAATATVSLFLLAKVFASGCAAMTGVEAVSNGVMAFRDPTARNARITLTVIIVMLIVLLLGIAFMCDAYGIGATNPDGANYQSVLSQLTMAVAGRGIFYYVTIGSILLVLSLSANTAFADFPRLTRAVAHNDYLPHMFGLRGRRLLYSAGVYVLVLLTAGLLIIFDGVTDRLIPLYAIGAFLAFTLSQSGMVVHWLRKKGPGWQIKILVNGIGALATGFTLMVVLVTKFVSGAWVTALLIPLMILFMSVVKKHYERVDAETEDDTPLEVEGVQPAFVVVPLDRWSKITEKGIRFALTLSHDIQGVHVDCGERNEGLEAVWQRNVEAPFRNAGLPVPSLVTLQSPYRMIITPLVEYVLKVGQEHPGRTIAVLVPELVVKRWWQYPMHNQRAQLLKLMLLWKGNQNIVVLNIPWYLHQ
jgi:amino acid transporter